MLRARHANRVEQLLEALVDALPPTNPFAPTTIVVGSRLVGRYVRRQLAFTRGIAAGLDIVTFEAFVERTWAGDAAAKAAGLVALDRSQLAAAVASVLADETAIGEHAAVAAYLAAAPAAGDAAGPRRVQLAEHLAHLAWTYALTRPDWMPALLAGHVPSELATHQARWQAALLGAAIRRASPDGDGKTLRAAPVPALPWLRRQARVAPPRAAGPITVFGASTLARAQLEALTDLAATTDVTVYALDPCEELWDDVGGRKTFRADAPTSDPLPLILWGKPVRETVAALIERSDGDVESLFDAPLASTTAAAPTALALLLDDVRHRRSPGIADPASGAAGVVVHACPNARRELEIIAQEARRLLDADPTLSAHEIAVWLAGDPDDYLAQAPSAFEAVGVPCHLVDAPIDDRGRIGEAVLALLELPVGDGSRRELLRVMTHPALLAGHPHADAAQWIRWTDELGIAHGADEQAHAGTYLEEHPGQFHWDQGVRRLALGAFMVGDRAKDRGPARIGLRDFAPEEVRSDQQASAATFALLVRSLTADAAWLASHTARLAEWAAIFTSLVDAYLSPRGDDGKRDRERVRNLLAALANHDVDGRHVGFREAREHAVRMLVSSRSDRGEPLASGVMVAPLGSMRAIPFRATFVAGLSEGAFPASDRASPLDLRTTARAGDLSARDRDRAAFLDVLLCARETLALSYVAAEPKSGQPVAPSSVVLELADALAPYLGAASSRDALAAITLTHPLHRFGGPADAIRSPAARRERWACGVRDALRNHLRALGMAVPDADGMHALLAHPAQAALRAELGIVGAGDRPAREGTERPLSMANLRSFLEWPVQAWAQTVLELDELPDDEAAQRSDEPFGVGKPERAVLLRDVLGAHLRDRSAPLDALYDKVARSRVLAGQFPVGVFGAATRDLDLGLLRRWTSAIGELPAPGATRIGFGRTTVAFADLLPALQITLPSGRTVRIVGQTELLIPAGEGRQASLVAMVGKLDEPSRHHLRGALDHVVLAAAGLAPRGHVHRLLGADGKVHEVIHAPWSQAEAQAYLVALVSELVDHAHGYLAPFDVVARALAGKSAWTPSRKPEGYGPITRADGLAVPPDIAEIARRRLGPLVERMTGDHKFEVST